MATYSHSRLSTFEQCRRKFKFQYLDRIKIPGQSVETFLGSMVHEALERLYEDLLHARMPTIDELLAFYGERWNAAWSDEVRIVKERYTRENYFDMGSRFIRDYYARHHPFDEGRTLGLETQDFLDLGGGNRFHVRIDRLADEGDGIYSVNDYKTNKHLPARDALDADRQLAAYSIWVRERFPDARRVRLVWHYLAHDRQEESERTAAELEELKAGIIETIRQVESCRSFPPSTSALCDWCDYKSICPAWIHELKVSGLPGKEFGEDDGVKLVDRLAELAGREKELEGEIGKVKDDILLYARRFGLDAVVGTASRAVIVESDAPLIPARGTPEREELERSLREMGLYEGLLSLNAAAVKKLDDDVIEKLGLEREERRSVRLGRRK